MNDNKNDRTEQLSITKTIPKVKESKEKKKREYKFEKALGTLLGAIVASIIVVMILSPAINSLKENKDDIKNSTNITEKESIDTLNHKFDMGFSITNWEASRLMQEDFNPDDIEKIVLEDISLTKEEFAFVNYDEKDIWTILETINKSHSFTLNEEENKDLSENKIRRIVETNLKKDQFDEERDTYDCSLLFTFSDFSLTYEFTYRYADKITDELYMINDDSILIGVIISVNSNTETSKQFRIIMNDGTYWTINNYFSITTTFYSLNKKTNAEGVILDESKLDVNNAPNEIKYLIGIWAMEDQGLKATYYFYNDKTGYYEYDLTTYKISYEVDGNTLFIAYLADGQTDSEQKTPFTYKIESDNLIMETGGAESTFKKVV